MVTSAESLGGRPRRLAPVPDAHYGRQTLNALRLSLTRAAGLAVAVGFAVAALASDEQRSARLVFT